MAIAFGLPKPFRVQPIVTLAYHCYHWLPTGFTIGSIFYRRSTAWVKRFTRENYVIKMEYLKNLSAETSWVTTIFPIQLTINNKKYIFVMRGETMKYISDSKLLLCYSCFPFKSPLWGSNLDLKASDWTDPKLSIYGRVLALM